MWDVRFSTEAEWQVSELVALGRFSDDDLAVIRDWIRLIRLNGPRIVRVVSHWCDHPLENEWFGYRSSSYSRTGRIIYKVFENKCLVTIERITPDHDYKRSEE